MYGEEVRYAEKRGTGLVVAGYITAILIPIVGFFVGLALMVCWRVWPRDGDLHKERLLHVDNRS